MSSLQPSISSSVQGQNIRDTFSASSIDADAEMKLSSNAATLTCEVLVMIQLPLT